MTAPQNVVRALPVFASAPSPGANTGGLFRVGTGLYYDNGTVLIPLDLQGNWASRDVAASDNFGGGTTPVGVNENIVYATAALTLTMRPASVLAFPINKPIEVAPIGGVAVTLAAATGVTFIGPNVVNNAITTTTPISLIQRSLNTWYVVGGAPASASSAFPTLFFSAIAGGGLNPIFEGNGSFKTISLGDGIVNIGGGTWDGSIYTVPAGHTSAVMEFAGQLRIADSYGTAVNVGLGIDTSNSDSPNFQWSVHSATYNGTNRNTFRYYSKRGVFNSGDQIRFFNYTDGTASAQYIAAALSIQRVL